MEKREYLYQLARDGESEARNKIIDSCNNYIKLKSIEAYNQITTNICQYYNIVEDNYHIPNSLLDLEDITQDFKLKSILYIPKFFELNCKMYFTSYLNHMLSSHIKKYINDKTRDIINQMNNCKNINFINQSSIITQNNNFDIQKEIIQNIINDKKLSRYFSLIKLIFEIKDLDEISRITGLEIKTIKNKIDNFSNLYLKSIAKNQANSKTEYLCSGRFLEDIKNGKLFDLLYYKKDVIFILHDIYYELSNKYGVSYKYVKREFSEFLYNSLNKNTKEVANIHDVDNYIHNVLKNSKKLFLLKEKEKLKYVASKKWDKYLINEKIIKEEEVINLLKSGQIYSITPFKEYIDIYIEKTYKETNKYLYIEKNVVTYHLVNIINNYIKRISPFLDFTFDSFNSEFIRHLHNKKKHYIYNKKPNDNKNLVLKK